MSEPEGKKPNLKPQAALAEWLTGLSSGKEQETKQPSIEIVQGETSGTNPSANQSIPGAEITGTEANDSPGQDSNVADIQPGEVIAGQYEIISLLGEGGMSAVYKAEDRLMRRFVALKCLHARLVSDKNATMRFQKEAQTAGNLNHPHIVKIHQFGFDNQNRPFLVMDYLEGEALQERLESGTKIGMAEALQILVQAAAGLEEAHKQGLIHRDFKPSNVMLVNTETDKDYVKIVDFGIAKVMTKPGEEAHNLTQTGEMLGSPNYMSPEQCMLMDLDNRTDVYAFGCTVFATFTGKAPFKSSNVVEIFNKHMSESPKSISVARPDIKEAGQIDAIILKCMAKEPSDRYQTMSEAKAAIQALIDGGKQNLVDSLREQLELNRLKSKAERSKRVSFLALGAATGTVLMVGFGAYFSGLFSKADEQNWHQFYINGQKSMDSGDYKTAEASLNKALESANNTGKVLGFVIPTMEEMLDLSLLDGNLPRAEKIRAEIDTLKNQYENSFPDLDRRLAQALNQIEAGSHAKDKASTEEIEQLCQTVNDQAGQLINDGYNKKAIEILKKADRLARTALGPKAAVQARTLHNMALAYNRSGDKTKAYDLYSQSVALVRDTISASDPSLIKGLIGMAGIDWHAGRSKLALTELNEARRIVNIALGPYSQESANVKVRLGEFYNSQKNTPLALEQFHQAWAIYQAEPKADIEYKARCLVGLAAADKTLKNLEQALLLQETSTRQDKASLAWILQSIGKLSTGQKAVAYYKRALAIAYRATPRNESRIAELLSTLNTYYFENNEPLGMEPWYLEKVRLDQAAYGKKSSIIVDDYLALAAMYRQARHLDKCEKTLQQALEVTPETDVAMLFKVNAALAAVTADQGLTEEALELNEKAVALYNQLSPEQQSGAGASTLFVRYVSLLEQLGKNEEAKTLKAKHKIYFAN